MLFNLIRYTAFALVAVLLASCAGTSQRQSAGSWPSHMPGVAYYQQAYGQDAENSQLQSEQDYLKWIKRFYVGWVLYPNGWDWLTANALSKANNPQERAILKERLALLGERVSAEWAKNADIRKINSSHLMVWGNALKLALKRGEADRLTAEIVADVDALLGEQLPADEIEFDRYFPENQAVIAHDSAAQDPFDA